MQITIDIPDELSHLIQNKGKSLDVAINYCSRMRNFDTATQPNH